MMVGTGGRRRLEDEYARCGWATDRALRAMTVALRARARRRRACRAPDRRCGTCVFAEPMTVGFAGVTADVDGAAACPYRHGPVRPWECCDAWEAA